MNCIKTVLAAGLILAFTAANAQNTAPLSAKHEQRLASRQKLEQDLSADCRLGHIKLKQLLQDKLGLQVGADISYTLQRGAPSGKQTAVQGIYYPYLTWSLFKDSSFGSGQVNFNYNLIRYWGTSAAAIQNRVKTAVAFNDYSANQEIFSQLTYTHTLPGELDWLSVTLGQFPLYNFDGTEYIANQQTALMNYSLAQNASSAYPSASLGAYMQAQAGAWTLSAGYQDATNLSGAQLRVKDAFRGAYTGFGAVQWAPEFEGNPGQYGVMYYYQPSVEGQEENVNGWSVNMQQNMSEKLAFFGRANGSSGGATPVKLSYAAGAAWLNPLERNTQDAIIIGAAYNRLSKKGMDYPPYMRSGEIVLEAQWVWGIGKFITVTPDVQFYPRAASNPDKEFVTVAGLRTSIML